MSDVDTLLCKTSHEAVINKGNIYPRVCCDHSLFGDMAVDQQESLQTRCNNKRALLRMEQNPTTSYDMATGVIYWPPPEKSDGGSAVHKILANQTAIMMGGPIAITMAITGIQCGGRVMARAWRAAGARGAENWAKWGRDAEQKSIKKRIEQLEEKGSERTKAENIELKNLQDDEEYIDKLVKGESTDGTNAGVESGVNSRVAARTAAYEDINNASVIAKYLKKLQEPDAGGGPSILEGAISSMMLAMPIWQIVQGEDAGKAIGSNVTTIAGMEAIKLMIGPMVKTTVLSLAFVLGDISNSLGAMVSKEAKLTVGKAIVNLFRNRGVISVSDLKGAGLSDAAARELETKVEKNLGDEVGLDAWDKTWGDAMDGLFKVVDHNVIGFFVTPLKGTANILGGLGQTVFGGALDAAQTAAAKQAAAEFVTNDLLANEGKLQGDIDAYNATIKRMRTGDSDFGNAYYDKDGKPITIKDGDTVPDEAVPNPAYDRLVEQRDAKQRLLDKLNKDPPEDLLVRGETAGKDLNAYSDIFESGDRYTFEGMEDAANDLIAAENDLETAGNQLKLLQEYINSRDPASWRNLKEGRWAEAQDKRWKELFEGQKVPKNQAEADQMYKDAQQKYKEAKEAKADAEGRFTDVDNPNNVFKKGRKGEGEGERLTSEEVKELSASMQEARDAALGTVGSAESLEACENGELLGAISGRKTPALVGIGSDRGFGTFAKNWNEQLARGEGDLAAFGKSVFKSLFTEAKGAGLEKGGMWVGKYFKPTAAEQTAIREQGVFEGMGSRIMAWIAEHTKFIGGDLLIELLGKITSVVTVPLKAATAVAGIAIKAALTAGAVTGAAALMLSAVVINIVQKGLLTAGVVAKMALTNLLKRFTETGEKEGAEQAEKEGIGAAVREIWAAGVGDGAGTLALSAGTSMMAKVCTGLVELGIGEFFSELTAGFMAFQMLLSFASMIWGATQGAKAAKHIWANMLKKEQIDNMLKSLHDKYKTFLPKTYDGSSIAPYSFEYNVIEDAVTCSNYDQERCELEGLGPNGEKGPAMYGQKCIWTYSHYNSPAALAAANDDLTQRDKLMMMCQIKNQDDPSDVVNMGENTNNTPFSCGPPASPSFLGMKGQCYYNQTCWGDKDVKEADQCVCKFTEPRYPASPSLSPSGKTGIRNADACQTFNEPESKTVPKESLGINWEAIRLMYVEEYIMNLEYNDANLRIEPAIPDDPNNKLWAVSQEEYLGVIANYNSLLMKISNQNTIIANFLGKWGYVIFVVVFIVIVLFIIMN